MARFVLDTDTISYILQQREPVFARLAKAVEDDADIYLCPMVYCEENPLGSGFRRLEVWCLVPGTGGDKPLPYTGDRVGM